MERGTGFKNIYVGEAENLATKPFWGSKPKGHKLHQRWYNTGGIGPRTAKRAPLLAGGGGAAAYGSSYYPDPGNFSTSKDAWKTVTDPKRRKLAVGGGLGAAALSSPLTAAAALYKNKEMSKYLGEKTSVPWKRLQRQRKDRLGLPDAPTGRTDALRREAQMNYWGKPQ
jgi:hypothetical protein